MRVVLDGKQRSYLRGLAHDRQPILQIGKAGATKALLEELDRALETHELVKIRVLRECPTDGDAIVLSVEQALGVTTVATLGRIITVYRARFEKPSITLPVKAKRPKMARRAAQSRDDQPGRTPPEHQ